MEWRRIPKGHYYEVSNVQNGPFVLCPGCIHAHPGESEKCDAGHAKLALVSVNPFVERIDKRPRPSRQVYRLWHVLLGRTLIFAAAELGACFYVPSRGSLGDVLVHDPRKRVSLFLCPWSTCKVRTLLWRDVWSHTHPKPRPSDNPNHAFVGNKKNTQQSE